MYSLNTKFGSGLRCQNSRCVHHLLYKSLHCFLHLLYQPCRKTLTQHFVRCFDALLSSWERSRYLCGLQYRSGHHMWKFISYKLDDIWNLLKSTSCSWFVTANHSLILYVDLKWSGPCRWHNAFTLFPVFVAFWSTEYHMCCPVIKRLLRSMITYGFFVHLIAYFIG